MPDPTTTLTIPGSFADWLNTTLAALGSSPSVDDVRRALASAKRTERLRGYFLTLDATAPVLELLDAFAADCVALGRPATGHNTREAAQRTRLRIVRARLDLGSAR